MYGRMLIVGLLAIVAMAVPAQAAPQSGEGTIALAVDVPDAGIALIEIRNNGGDGVLRTVVVDADTTVAVVMPTGTYKVVPRQVTVDGERFVAGAQPYTVNVKAAKTSSVAVVYARSLGVQNLRVTELGDTSVSLDWDAELGDDTTVWRLDGDDASTRPGQGTEVALTDPSSLTDYGLTAGGVYTYTIFARPGDGAFGRNDVDPVSITVSLDDDDPSTPLFVLSPGTVILDEDEFTPYSTGESLILELGAGLAMPTPGSSVIVPVTAQLPGGYLGEVVGISEDGRRIELVMGAMASAFDLYHLAVPDIGALPDPAFDDETGPPPGTLGGSLQGTSLKALSPPGTKCGSGASSLTVTPSFAQSHTGHADVTIDKWKIKFFPDVPHTLNYDVGYVTTLQATVKVSGQIAANCVIDLQRFFKNVTYYPLPLALEVKPTARISLFGKGTIENVGGSVTAGFQTDGKLSLTGLPEVGGDIILEANATEPKSTNEAGLNLQVGGTVTFGPGIGTNNVGIIFGLSGSFAPLDATASIVKVTKNNTEDTCVKLDAQTKAGLSASLRAWIPGYSADYSVTIDQLQGEWKWFGSPYWFPYDCTKSGTPTNDVVGDGLTVIDDDVTGGDNQFGKVDGFVPGQSTWILSTGNINEVAGPPSFFASTDLGGAGDAALSQLAGQPTYDAVAYQVTVVPTGSTLVVRYAFGSEEYPEYVGSVFNDVMAVFVNGQNCALVPGSTTPVSINTINHLTNSLYYVDNSVGATGYNTTMDGLTVPIECRVPVTPGEQVTVRIAVADASDGIYDSAVALLDGGIYSE